MKQPQHIACLLPNLAGGGQERVTLNLLRGLSGKGRQLDLVVAQAKGPYLDQIPPEVQLVDLGVSMEDRLQSAVKLILPLARYLRQAKPDILLSHLVWTNEIAVIAYWLARRPLQLVLWEQMPASLQASHSLTQGVKLWLMRSLYPKASAIVAPSRGVAQAFEQSLKLKANAVQVVYNAVVDDTLLQKAQAPLNHPWFFAYQPPVILAIGRLSEQKDFPTLIKAFAQVRKNRLLRLIILGEGGLRRSLENLVRELGVGEDVQLPGFVPNPYAYLSRAAMFVLSSKFEGLPTVVIEALACGCPVVSTDCPYGPREILADGQYGRLVTVGDVQGLARGIYETLNAPVSRDLLKVRSQAFTVQEATQSYLKLLSN
ncbi:glycosyltransferase [Spirulina subsalsa FACHB-351]|uniref:Glycosyltransferase n=1 Tax=Spirulina subsalsa FACHB-351 TaxID=234711 RepID=A0ABT3L857_9CYAN|nr:glycosyltransferase [Spirulina subsalsa]MCW6037695.1 glycosyltransferase [Spirulina subsalsa FACHB-351]